MKKNTKPCRDCGAMTGDPRSVRCSTCANRWTAKHRKRIYATGPDHPRWKGGKMTSKQGGHYYVYLLLPDHPRAYRKYVKRADVVLEKKLGRRLRRNEIAHHKDCNTLNDSPRNLEAMTRLQHIRLHQKDAVRARWPARAKIKSE